MMSCLASIPPGITSRIMTTSARSLAGTETGSPKGSSRSTVRTITLATNNGPNHLHGGKFGFDQRVWEADEEESEPGRALVLKYVSKDGEEGYPGTLSVKVRYAVTDSNELRIEYSAVTDKPTIVNLTQHSYFNLAGQGNGDILGHELNIVADRFTPVDSTLIPTGELRPVEGTPMDFRIPVAIGARINQKDQQLIYGGGYDHNWVLTQEGQHTLHSRRAYMIRRPAV